MKKYGAIEIPPSTDKTIVVYEVEERGKDILIRFEPVNGGNRKVIHHTNEGEQIKDYLEQLRETRKKGSELVERLKRMI